MAPEQTGRINRSIDYRTDYYYAFGATLFKLLTGKPPFQGDILKLIQAHLLKNPPDLTKLNPQVPSVLNHIVQKLLAKSPEDRYQSSHAIKKDLEACLEMIEQGKINTFPIAQADVPKRFTLSRKIYGRESIIHKVEQFIEQTEHPLSTLFIAGKPGIGKTSVIREVEKTLALRGGFVCEGKFDQLHRTSPYSAWILVAQLSSIKSSKMKKLMRNG